MEQQIVMQVVPSIPTTMEYETPKPRISNTVVDTTNIQYNDEITPTTVQNVDDDQQQPLLLLNHPTRWQEQEEEKDNSGKIIRTTGATNTTTNNNHPFNESVVVADAVFVPVAESELDHHLIVKENGIVSTTIPIPLSTTTGMTEDTTTASFTCNFKPNGDTIGSTIMTTVTTNTNDTTSTKKRRRKESVKDHTKKKISTQSLSSGKKLFEKKKKQQQQQPPILRVDDLTYDWSELQLGVRTGSGAWNQSLQTFYTSTSSGDRRHHPCATSTQQQKSTTATNKESENENSNGCCRINNTTTTTIISSDTTTTPRIQSIDLLQTMKQLSQSLTDIPLPLPMGSPLLQQTEAATTTAKIEKQQQEQQQSTQSEKVFDEEEEETAVAVVVAMDMIPNELQPIIPRLLNTYQKFIAENKTIINHCNKEINNQSSDDEILSSTDDDKDNSSNNIIQYMTMKELKTYLNSLEKDVVELQRWQNMVLTTSHQLGILDDDYKEQHQEEQNLPQKVVVKIPSDTNTTTTTTTCTTTTTTKVSRTCGRENENGNMDWDCVEPSPNSFFSNRVGVLVYGQEGCTSRSIQFLHPHDEY